VPKLLISGGGKKLARGEKHTHIIRGDVIIGTQKKPVRKKGKLQRTHWNLAASKKKVAGDLGGGTEQFRWRESGRNGVHTS